MDWLNICAIAFAVFVFCTTALVIWVSCDTEPYDDDYPYE